MNTIGELNASLVGDDLIQKEIGQGGMATISYRVDQVDPESGRRSELAEFHIRNRVGAPDRTANAR